MTGRVVRSMGDRALLVELADGERPHEFADAVDSAAIAGVDDCVPAAATVLVRLSAAGDLRRVRDTLEVLAVHAAGGSVHGTVEIPTRYDGPDLVAVADAVGVSVDEVVARHVAATYTVAFVGFAPGFAYLDGGDPLLRVARHSSPRTRVPARAVGLADRYTGVYPRPSPGGWQLIGTTELTLFDTDRRPPALLTPGTTVRFAVVRP